MISITKGGDLFYYGYTSKEKRRRNNPKPVETLYSKDSAKRCFDSCPESQIFGKREKQE